MSVVTRALLMSEWRSLSTSAVLKMAAAVHAFSKLNHGDGVRLLAEASELAKRALEIKERLDNA
jgi:hypothetical protein